MITIMIMTEAAHGRRRQRAGLRGGPGGLRDGDVSFVLYVTTATTTTTTTTAAATATTTTTPTTTTNN